MIQLCVSFLVLVMTLFYCQPPLETEETKLSFSLELKRVGGSAQFWIAMILFSVPFGEFIAVWSTLGLLLEEQNFSNVSSLAATVGLVMIAGGIFGSIIIGLVIDRLRGLKVVCLYVCVCFFFLKKEKKKKSSISLDLPSLCCNLRYWHMRVLLVISLVCQICLHGCVAGVLVFLWNVQYSAVACGSRVLCRSNFSCK